MKLERQGTDYRAEDVPKVSEEVTKPREWESVRKILKIQKGHPRLYKHPQQRHLKRTEDRALPV